MRNFRRTIIGATITGIFLALFLVNIAPAEAKSYNTTLYYGDYFVVHSGGTMDTSGSIYWFFSATNNVWLDVWIFDDTNYDLFYNGYSASGYHVSIYEGSSDSGTFNIPHEDKWHVVFWDEDLLELFSSTYVSITVNFYGLSSNLTLILAIVIPIVVLASIGLAVGLSVKNKRKKAEIQQSPLYQQPVGTYQQPTYYPPVQPVQTQPLQSQPAQKYCNSCGSANKIENRFCINCGSDMNET